MVDFNDLDPLDDDPQFDGGLELGEVWPSTEPLDDWMYEVQYETTPGGATCPRCEYPFTPTVEYPSVCADCTRRSYGNGR